VLGTRQVRLALLIFALDLVPISPLVVRSRTGCVGTHVFFAFSALFPFFLVASPLFFLFFPIEAPIFFWLPTAKERKKKKE
jgi:hypothetical protein